MAEISIGNRVITKGSQPFIIAEAGINHNGEMEKAFEMICIAKKSGADAIKFQTFKADQFISDPNLMFTYKSQGLEITESMLDMFRRYEFSEKEWYLIKKKCDEQGIMFLSTPQNTLDLEMLLKIGIPAIKVGSDDFNNLPLLKRYSQTGLPIILSIGMADLGEVYQSLSLVGTLDGYPIVLLLCTSQYPTPAADTNLRKLKTLSAAFPMTPMGFSDHTEGPLASSLAVALGAVLIEKHFTLSHDLPGPDHWFAEDPDGLQIWIKSIREAYEMLGNGIVRPTYEEEKMKILARRSIVALEDIEVGGIFKTHNIGMKRPGNGISPSMFDHILGLTVQRKMKKGDQLKWGDFK